MRLPADYNRSFSPDVASRMVEGLRKEKPVSPLRPWPVPAPVAAPELLVRLEPWHRVFLRNLRDLVWFRKQPALVLSSRPGTFWPDVLVPSRTPWRGVLESAGYHTVVLGLIWLLPQIWFARPQMTRPAFANSQVITYSAADYLPPLDTGDHRATLPPRADPVYAPQAIISVPPEPDNRSQTIVTPPDIKLRRDVPLPNMVALPQPNIPIPIAVTARTAADMKLPSLTASVIAPAPDVRAESRTQRVQAPEPAVIGPPPSADITAIRRIGDINIGHSEVVAPAPQLPVAEQRTVVGAATSLGSGSPSVVPPAPSMVGSGTADSRGPLIALSLHPAPPDAPIEVPKGNRRGSFAAGPEGKADGSGNPGSTASSGTGAGTNGEGAGLGSGSHGKNAFGLPPGLYVGAGKDSTHASSVGGSGGDGAGNGAGHGSSSDPALVASATPPHVTAGRKPAAEVPETRATDVDHKVFGDRRFYSMSLNMPNLNSAGGSWVIRFAELDNKNEKGELLAPIATRKVDPAYPTELMHRNVAGTVTLRAVIRRDGSVGDVTVLRGVDDQLDQYASAALARWKFEPALKNGNAVDLEAVIVIPFRPVVRNGF